MRILLVEDVTDARRAMNAALIEAFPDPVLIEEASTLRLALDLIGRSQFDFAFVDLGLPDGSGLDVIRKLKASSPTTTSIVTTIMGDDASIVGALSAGAQGYLLKDLEPDILTRQLQQAHAGLPALSPSVARRIMNHFRQTAPLEPISELTQREAEVLSLIARGLRNAEVATALGLSEHTVAGYIKQIYQKLGISSRAEAAWLATRMGIGDPR